jgi:hypothetical protein
MAYTVAVLYAICESDFKTVDTRQKSLYHLFITQHRCFQPNSFRTYLRISKHAPFTLTRYPANFSIIYTCQKKAAAKPFHPDTDRFKSVALKYTHRYLALGISP